MRQNDSPQNWAFSAGVSGLEQLAIWKMVENLAQTNMAKMLSKVPDDKNT